MDTAAFGSWGFDQRGWGRNTSRQYRLTIRRAHEWFEWRGLDLDDVDADQLREWFATVKATATARNQARKAAVAYFAFLVDTGRRDDDPSEALRRLREPDPIPRSLTESSASRFMAAAEQRGTRDRAMACVFLFGALRASELAALAWGEVDDGWLHFRGKGRKERHVPLHPTAIRALSAWHAQCPSTQWVFPRPGEPWTHVHYCSILGWVKAVAEAAGLDGVTPHVLRHTAATMLLDSGADTLDVKELLGHSNVATTQRYLRVRPRRLKDAVAKLDFSAAA